MKIQGTFYLNLRKMGFLVWVDSCCLKGHNDNVTITKPALADINVGAGLGNRFIHTTDNTITKPALADMQGRVLIVRLSVGFKVLG